MSLKLLAAADIHLGRSSSGAGLDGEDAFLYRASHTWITLCKLACRKEADALLLAGDIADELSAYFEASSAFSNGLRILKDASIPVIMVSGNHDYAILPRLADDYQNDGLYLLGNNGSWDVRDFKLGGGQLRCAGWSFPDARVYTDPLEHFPDVPNDNVPLIGLLHGDFGTTRSSYAPLSEAKLLSAGPQVWVLGHIHKPMINTYANKTILYPGSLQALSPKETGAHGAVWLENKEGFFEAKPVELSTVRYEKITVSPGNISNELDLKSTTVSTIENYLRQWSEEEHAELRECIADISLTGEHPDVEELSRIAQKLQGDAAETGFRLRIRIRKVHNLCTVPQSAVEDIAVQKDMAGVLARLILQLENKDELLDDDTLRLLENLESRRQFLRNQNVYSALRQDSPELAEFTTDDQLRQLLLHEARILLSGLLKTKTGN
ncbi:MAG: DNA repair exonuclease [Balneolales bacterium]|nr:DNA repair exonuclease [Balneolales bacterium]